MGTSIQYDMVLTVMIGTCIYWDTSTCAPEFTVCKVWTLEETSIYMVMNAEIEGPKSPITAPTSWTWGTLGPRSLTFDPLVAMNCCT